MYSILLVEDEVQIQAANKILLERRGGYHVRLAMNLAEARQAVAESKPDLILLDIMLPDGSGLDYLKELKQQTNIPVLLLTALSETSDEIRGIEEGGDDYISKPYDNNLLLARIDGLLRRVSRVPDNVRKGSLTLDTYSSKAYIDGGDLGLTSKEFDLLLLLTQSEDKLLKPEYVYEKVWSQPMLGDNSAVKTIISKLRRKIEPSGYDIETLYGKGYIFTKK